MVLKVDRNGEICTLALTGEVTLDQAEALSHALTKANIGTADYVLIDGAAVTVLDTAGAMIINRQRAKWQAKGYHVSLKNFAENQQRILDMVAVHLERPKKALGGGWTLFSVVEDVGLATEKIVRNFTGLIAFSGLVTERFFYLLRHPSKLRITPLVHQLDQIGFRALAIVGLITFLIGAVVVNQGAFYLRQVGAEVFTIDLISITMLREFGILLTAIIVAGRSGSAFTAQIGSMQLNEEVDAMRTLDMHPIDVLVMPRLIGLVLVMPLLAFYADIMGLLGGGLTAWLTLDVSPISFIQRFEEAVSLSSFYVGILKAPFFGLMIGLSGCYEGMSVQGSAEKLGRHTTRSVVQSVFLVIIMDAVFAMLFTALNI